MAKSPNPIKVPAPYLRRETKEKWATWCKSIDGQQTGFMSRVVEFIMEQDESTRCLFLRQVSNPDRQALAVQILQRIADNDGQSGDHISPVDRIRHKRNTKKVRTKKTKN